MITLQHTFPESTSRTQTQGIAIDKLKEVSSVTVNTGYVSVVSVVDDLVTLQFTSGSYSRVVQTGGSYTPGDSKYGLSTVVRVTYIYDKWTGTKWLYSHETSMTPHPDTVFYNKDGYSGDIPKTGGIDIKVEDYTTAPPQNPSVGDTWVRALVRNTQTYQGIVTRPASDTRTWRYYYQYTATINYLEKSLNMVYKTDGELRDAYQGWVLIDNELREIDNMKKLVDGELREC